MLEILKFYVSSFWVWLGITIGMMIFMQGIIVIITTVTKKRANG